MAEQVELIIARVRAIADRFERDSNPAVPVLLFFGGVRPELMAVFNSTADEAERERIIEALRRMETVWLRRWNVESASPGEVYARREAEAAMN